MREVRKFDEASVLRVDNIELNEEIIVGVTSAMWKLRERNSADLLVERCGRHVGVAVDDGEEDGGCDVVHGPEE